MRDAPAITLPSRAQAMTAAVLVAASVSNLPIVYVLVRDGIAPPPAALGIGFIAMGLAWAAGFHVQGKRRGLVTALAAMGVLEAAALALPYFAPVRAWILVSAALALGGLLLARRGT